MVSMSPQTMVSLTPEALKQLKDFMVEQGTPEGKLRVFVSPGGCSGLEYGMSVEEEVDEDDYIFEQDGITVIVDSFSAMYIEGSEIDYVNSLMGGGFTVRNPNAVTSCACGHSFDTGENAGTSMGCGCGA
jgi:iron-sulfur cluster assembly protein